MMSWPFGLIIILFFISLLGRRVVVVRCEGINISGSFYRNKCKCWYSFLPAPVLPPWCKFSRFWHEVITTLSSLWVFILVIICPGSVRHSSLKTSLFFFFILLFSVKYLDFLRKRCNVNPARGEFHFRAPSKILWRVVRGMLPHKTRRGNIALARLRSFEGVPPPYDKVKRFVVPNALRVVRLNPRRKYCSVGRLSHEVGWKYQNVIETLELKRKAKAQLRFAKKKRDAKLLKAAREEAVKAKKITKHLDTLQSLGYCIWEACGISQK